MGMGDRSQSLAELHFFCDWLINLFERLGLHE